MLLFVNYVSLIIQVVGCQRIDEKQCNPGYRADVDMRLGLFHVRLR